MPEGVAFKRRAEEVGFKQVVRERDHGEPIAAPDAVRYFPRKGDRAVTARARRVG